MLSAPFFFYFIYVPSWVKFTFSCFHPKLQQVKACHVFFIELFFPLFQEMHVDETDGRDKKYYFGWQSSKYTLEHF